MTRIRRRAGREDILYLRGIAAFQWDWRVAESLLPLDWEYTLDIRRGRVRYVIRGGKVYLTLRPTDGYFSLSVEAAERVRVASTPPRYRLVVSEEAELKGSVLAPVVKILDENLRPGDEVLIVDNDDRLLAVGRLRVPSIMINGLTRGEVARVRVRVRGSGDSG